MPKKVDAWKCDFCDTVWEVEEAILLHERTCQHNPKKKGCWSCENFREDDNFLHWCFLLKDNEYSFSIENCDGWEPVLCKAPKKENIEKGCTSCDNFSCCDSNCEPLWCFAQKDKTLKYNTIRDCSFWKQGLWGELPKERERPDFE